jgi:zinc/manganese transport system substrate-binding protein
MTIQRMMSLFIAIFASFFLIKAHALINIVAAENVYGNVAKQLGGPYVAVLSILNNPGQDPHLFTTTPSVAKAVNHADIIIYNGADYDPWMNALLNIAGQKGREQINVASLVGIKSGENPHLWYLPTVMPQVAKAITAGLIQQDPTHQAYYESQLKIFNQDYQHIIKSVAALKKQFAGVPVIATEPVFGYMAKAIGLVMLGEDFQINVMNDTPPTVSQIKAFEDALSSHQVKLLIYNNQVSNPLTKHLRLLAEKMRIPILGVNELMPANETYVSWMLDTLTRLQTALTHIQSETA